MVIQDLAAGDFLPAQSLADGDLYYYPGSNGNGAPYASFTFQVQDSGLTANGVSNIDPTPKTMTLNVTSVNDAPQGTSKTVTMLEDVPYTVTAADSAHPVRATGTIAPNCGAVSTGVATPSTGTVLPASASFTPGACDTSISA